MVSSVEETATIPIDLPSPGQPGPGPDAPPPTPDTGFSPELPFAEPCLEPYVSTAPGTALSTQFSPSPNFDPTQTPTVEQSLEPLRVSDGPNSGLGTNLFLWNPLLSGDGSTVFFNTPAKNLAFENTTRPYLTDRDFYGFLYAKNLDSGSLEFVDTNPGEDTPAFGEGISGVSGDGRYVVFVTNLALVPEDQNDDLFYHGDVYRLDRETGEIILVSHDSTGAAVSGSAPSISADGNTVVFDSSAPELLPPGETGDLYVRDINAGTIELVGDGVLHVKCISADGNRVTYYAPTDPLDPDFRLTTMYMYDRTTGARVVVSPHPPGTTGTTRNQSISADGNTVVFTSFSSSLVPNDNNEVTDVFAYDIDTDTLERLSVSESGEEGNATSGRKSLAVSGDGRYVAFRSEASNLVPDDDNDNIDCFLVDRQLDTIRRLNVGPNGEPPRAELDKRESSEVLESFVEDGPSISDDGRYVAFASNADNLVPNDINQGWDLFVFDTTTNTLTLQSRREDGQQAFANGRSYSAVISGNGRFVAFNSYTDRFTEISEKLTHWYFEGLPFYRDLATSTIDLMLVTDTGATFGVLDNGEVYAPFQRTSLNGIVSSISDDGSTAGFETCERLAELDEQRTLSPLQGVCNIDTSVYKAQSKTSEIISVTPDGMPAAPAYNPSLSSDGTIVGFSTRNNEIDPLVGIDMFSIFTRDRVQGCLQLQSVGDGDAPPDSDVYEIRLSGDGNFIAFSSAASNILGGGADPEQRIFIRERSTGATILASPAFDGSEPNGESRFGETFLFGNTVSADGRFIVYESLASNLVPNDTNDERDIFLFDLPNLQVTKVSQALGGGNANGASFRPNISGDGRYIVFSSLADNLVGDDSNGLEDVFVFDQLSGEYALVSRNRNGEPATGPSQAPAISRDGRYIAFSSYAMDIVEGDQNMTADIFRVRNPLSN